MLPVPQRVCSCVCKYAQRLSGKAGFGCGLVVAQKEEIVEVAQSVFGTIDRHAAEELPHSFAYVATEKLRQEAGQ